MIERELVDQQMRSFMDSLWERGDFWDIEKSAYERDRCVQLLKMLRTSGTVAYSRSDAAPVISHACSPLTPTTLLLSTFLRRPLTGRVQSVQVSQTWISA